MRLHDLLLQHLALLSECRECRAGGVRLGLGLRRHGAVVVVDHLHDRVAGAHRLVVAHEDGADIPGQMRAERRAVACHVGIDCHRIAPAGERALPAERERGAGDCEDDNGDDDQGNPHSVLRGYGGHVGGPSEFKLGLP